MSKRFKPLDINTVKNRILTGIKAYVNEEFIPEVVVPEVMEYVEELHAKTTRGWQGGSGAEVVSSKTHTEPNAPQIQHEVKLTRTGAEITLFVDSYIWNLLNQGRETRVTDRREVFIPRSNPRSGDGQRTLPGSLDVSTDRSYKEKVVVPKGTTISGFKGRGWSDMIKDEVEKKFGQKYPNLTVDFIVKEIDLG